MFRDEVTPTVMRELYAQLGSPALVSFDIDAVDQAFAPGVSAPCTGGFTPAEWLAFAQEAAATPRFARWTSPNSTRSMTVTDRPAASRR